MQTALLIFIVLFALAIGFFLGIFLISLDTPLTKSLVRQYSDTAEIDAQGSTDPDSPKPSPDSQLILKVWKEEGKPPVYEQGGVFFEKEQLPRELLNVITVQEETHIDPDPEPEPEPPVVDQETPVSFNMGEADVDIDTDEEELKMLSVVDEVNDILQKNLVGSPLAGKGIHLMENHNNEIRFWVGLNSYGDVEEIPDQDVRDIINASVKEWERKRG